MAFVSTTSRPVPNTFFADLKAGLAQRLAQYRAYRATMEEFSQLSDRELTDLGITRFDIRAIAHEASLRA